MLEVILILISLITILMFLSITTHLFNFYSILFMGSISIVYFAKQLIKRKIK
jgi:hypothetical protein